MSLLRPRTRSDPAEMGDRTPMLMSIQNPERVLNILRSSTLTSRVVGMGPAGRRSRAPPGGGGAGWDGRAGVPVPPLWWWLAGRSWRSCRNSFALGVGSEGQEHVFEPGALGGPELGEGDASCQGHRPDPSRVGVRAYGAVPCERAGDPGPFEGVREVAR